MLQLFAAILCLSIGPASAWAADVRTEETERAEAKVIEAKAFFKSALFEEAAASYLQAFAISRKPATLFNAARAYEEAKLYAKAIALFEQYVQLTDTPADGRREANERIAHDHAQLSAIAAGAAANHPEPVPAAEEKPPVTKPADVTSGEAAVATAKPGDAKPAAAAGTEPAAPEPKRSNWLDWALFAGGDTLALIGVLGWAGAANAINRANAMDFSVLGAEASYKQQVASAQSSRGGSAVIGVVGLGLAGWGAWRLWGPGSGKAAEAPAKAAGWLIPTVAPDAAGLAWGGRF